MQYFSCCSDKYTEINSKIQSPIISLQDTLDYCCTPIYSCGCSIRVFHLCVHDVDHRCYVYTIRVLMSIYTPYRCCNCTLGVGCNWVLMIMGVLYAPLWCQCQIVHPNGVPWCRVLMTILGVTYAPLRC